MRRELKFVVHHTTRAMLLERWSPYLVQAPFTDDQARTPILSQYYDSPTLTFFDEKTDGVAIRNKVRLRTYGTSYAAGNVAFVEIKHRRYDRVKKYRQRIPDFEPGHLSPSRWEFDQPEMASLFSTLIETHRLRPSAQTYYQREAYEAPVEAGLRVTFDSNLVGLHPGEALTDSLLRDRRRHLMPDTLFVLEVKSNEELPRWVHEGIIAGELQQKTVPKYTTAVTVLGLHASNGSGVYL